VFQRANIPSHATVPFFKLVGTGQGYKWAISVDENERVYDTTKRFNTMVRIKFQVEFQTKTLHSNTETYRYCTVRYSFTLRLQSTLPRNVKNNNNFSLKVSL